MEGFAITRFEVTRSRRGNVLISFWGPHKVPAGSVARASGGDIVVERPGLRPLVFLCADPGVGAVLAGAGRILVHRAFDLGGDVVTEVGRAA